MPQPAAAFIDQIHRAELARGETLAIKVQYPGVARRIELKMPDENKALNCSPKGVSTLLTLARLDVHAAR